MSKPQLVEAVMFFSDDGGICKQMFFAEFEALLDGLVNMPAFADQQVRVVYLMINARLQVRSAVFFYLDFDEQGAPDSGWNIPLQQMAERAGRGPDLGGGPIRLACRSQCPVSWQQMHLWDPSLAAGNNDLALLRDTVKRNSLGILVEEEGPQGVVAERLQVAPEDQWYASDASREVAEKLAERLAQEYRLKAAQLVKQQRERIAVLAREHAAEIAGLKAAGDEHEQGLQAQIQALRQALRQQEALVQSLKGQLAEQQNAQRQERDDMLTRLRAMERYGRTEREVLRTQFDEELRTRIAATLSAAEEQALLREARAEHLMLERLAGQGVVFVVFHPGAGHLTVPLQDIGRYLASPMAYAASKCCVPEAQYRQWLEHYQQPTCDGLQSNGERCGASLERVETPGRFVAGDSNCCMRHKAVGRLRTVG
ncbi:chromosome partitioning protein ParA [Phytopseudomonas dryadis]|uniref:Chromosome partitioning protein ParA n=1 Tax=Phytopseudomonas dryadis TaxID=2487520 RepID=A0ABY1Z431_9GAMM|nr:MULTISPECIES: chromosome partitioning protein ParA [Pseudomonas]TBV03779.1 chromosome partitioning protein ParA [Pseudomonas dryadis]TBV15996.1 chromosome partitioning protein ParA [Pseudomonas sp. FRB 230]